MFIAFEGPDKTGKSTSAANLASDEVALYNVTKEMHQQQRERDEVGTVVTYDRIDWLSHMVYRLAMPDHEWNDARPRTVFTMPDTHLVLKMHHPVGVDLIEDELYEAGRLAPVNEMYYHQVMFLADMNKLRDYSWFRSISVMEVHNDLSAGTFEQRLVFHENAMYSGSYFEVLKRSVVTNNDLLEFLYEQDVRL